MATEAQSNRDAFIIEKMHFNHGVRLIAMLFLLTIASTKHERKKKVTDREGRAK